MLISPCDPCHWSEIHDQMTVAIETGQKSRSAPPHPKKKTRHSVIGTKRSLEFRILEAAYESLGYTYFVLCSPVFCCNSESCEVSND